MPTPDPPSSRQLEAMYTRFLDALPRETYAMFKAQSVELGKCLHVVIDEYTKKHALPVLVPIMTLKGMLFAFELHLVTQMLDMDAPPTAPPTTKAADDTDA